MAEDCAEVEPLFNQGISVIRKGRNCEYIQNMAADEGYDSVSEYIEVMEAELQLLLNELGCP